MVFQLKKTFSRKYFFLGESLTTFISWRTTKKAFPSMFSKNLCDVLSFSEIEKTQYKQESFFLSTFATTCCDPNDLLKKSTRHIKMSNINITEIFKRTHDIGSFSKTFLFFPNKSKMFFYGLCPLLGFVFFSQSSFSQLFGRQKNFDENILLLVPNSIKEKIRVPHFALGYRRKGKLNKTRMPFVFAPSSLSFWPSAAPFSIRSPSSANAKGSSLFLQLKPRAERKMQRLKNPKVKNNQEEAFHFFQQNKTYLLLPSIILLPETNSLFEFKNFKNFKSKLSPSLTFLKSSILWDSVIRNFNGYLFQKFITEQPKKLNFTVFQEHQISNSVFAPVGVAQKNQGTDNKNNLLSSASSSSPKISKMFFKYWQGQQFLFDNHTFLYENYFLYKNSINNKIFYPQCKSATFFSNCSLYGRNTPKGVPALPKERTLLRQSRNPFRGIPDLSGTRAQTLKKQVPDLYEQPLLMSNNYKIGNKKRLLQMSKIIKTERRHIQKLPISWKAPKTKNKRFFFVFPPYSPSPLVFDLPRTGLRLCLGEDANAKGNADGALSVHLPPYQSGDKRRLEDQGQKMENFYNQYPKNLKTFFERTFFYEHAKYKILPGKRKSFFIPAKETFFNRGKEGVNSKKLKIFNSLKYRFNSTDLFPASAFRDKENSPLIRYLRFRPRTPSDQREKSVVRKKGMLSKKISNNQDSLKNVISPNQFLAKNGFAISFFKRSLFNFPACLPLQRMSRVEGREKESNATKGVFHPKTVEFTLAGNFQQRSNFSDNRENLSYKRLLKEKNAQKKRRRKKLKLETRRRKKRKRFYPRPIWLRFSLYKQFLKKRHFKKVKKSKHLHCLAFSVGSYPSAFGQTRLAFPDGESQGPLRSSLNGRKKERMSRAKGPKNECSLGCAGPWRSLFFPPVEGGTKGKATSLEVAHPSYPRFSEDEGGRQRSSIYREPKSLSRKPQAKGFTSVFCKQNKNAPCSVKPFPFGWKFPFRGNSKIFLPPSRLSKEKIKTFWSFTSLPFSLWYSEPSSNAKSPIPATLGVRVFPGALGVRSLPRTRFRQSLGKAGTPLGVFLPLREERRGPWLSPSGKARLEDQGRRRRQAGTLGVRAFYGVEDQEMPRTRQRKGRLKREDANSKNPRVETQKIENQVVRTKTKSLLVFSKKEKVESIGGIKNFKIKSQIKLKTKTYRLSKLKLHLNASATFQYEKTSLHRAVYSQNSQQTYLNVKNASQQSFLPITPYLFQEEIYKKDFNQRIEKKILEILQKIEKLSREPSNSQIIYKPLIFSYLHSLKKDLKVLAFPVGECQEGEDRKLLVKSLLNTPKKKTKPWNYFLQPDFSAPSLFSRSVDSTIKPYGKLPTLRALWAFQKTQTFSFKENNASLKLWQHLKKREEIKSNKTKKWSISLIRSAKSTFLQLLSQPTVPLSKTVWSLPKKGKDVFFTFFYKQNKNILQEESLKRNFGEHQRYEQYDKKRWMLPTLENKKISLRKKIISTLASENLNFPQPFSNSNFSPYFLNKTKTPLVFGVNVMPSPSPLVFEPSPSANAKGPGEDAKTKGPEIEDQRLKGRREDQRPKGYQNAATRELLSIVSFFPRKKEVKKLKKFFRNSFEKTSAKFLQQEKKLITLGFSFPHHSIVFKNLKKNQQNVVFDNFSKTHVFSLYSLGKEANNIESFLPHFINKIRKESKQSQTFYLSPYFWISGNLPSLSHPFLIGKNSLLFMPFQWPNFFFSSLQRFILPHPFDKNLILSSFPLGGKIRVNDFYLNSNKNQKESFQASFLVFASLGILHFFFLSLFLQLPEVRTFLKFQMLLFLKILHGCFIFVFALFNLLKSYKNESLGVFKIVKNTLIDSPIDLRRGMFAYSESLPLELKSPSLSPLVFDLPRTRFRLCLGEDANTKGSTTLTLGAQSLALLTSKGQRDPWHSQKASNSIKKLKNKDTKSQGEKNKRNFFIQKRLRRNSESILLTSGKFKKTNVLLFTEPLALASCFPLRPWSSSLAFPDAFGLTPKGLGRESQGPLRSSLRLRRPLAFASSPRSKTKGHLLRDKEGEGKHKVFVLLFPSGKLESLSSFFLQEQVKIKKILSFDSLNLSQSFSFVSFYVKTVLFLLFYSGLRNFQLFLQAGSIFISFLALKGIEFLEGSLLILYQFLEKPAELVVEWMAEIFLVEWSSSPVSFIPETLDTSIINSLTKLSLGLRSSGFLGFFLQRSVNLSMETFLQLFLKADADLIMRQKRGLLFWNFWEPILVEAAQRYGIHSSSLTALKEENDLFTEKLFQDTSWESWTPQVLPHSSLLPKTNFSLQEFRVKLAPLFSLWLSYSSPLVFDLPRTGFRLCLGALGVRRRGRLENQGLRGKQGGRNFQKKIKQNKVPTLITINPPTPYGVPAVPKKLNTKERWPLAGTEGESAANQYYLYQGKDSHLFVDLHPPKSLSSINLFANSEPLSSFLGSILCKAYSGTARHQVAKNLLVTGPPGNEKSLWILALAGEVESKIVVDHAKRYAIPNSGSTGMKLLRDVFISLALHTPCFFLLEDIHYIGERRPMSLGDDENAKATDSSFVGNHEEVHEKNQILYQLSLHSLIHYKKPYKGDFSLFIPTNLFQSVFFLGTSPPRTRQSGLTSFPPLNIKSLEKQSLDSQINFSKTLGSLLQKKSSRFFAPPATSPFTIFNLKEKQKPKKRVQELSWGGFSFEGGPLHLKSTYSIRVKVSIIAEKVLRQLSVELDRITDLLVIMDNVRANKGFVVFATTHKPSVLDPALRRPGRFDESLALPTFPNFMQRFFLFKKTLGSWTSTVDFVDYTVHTMNLSEKNLEIFLANTKFSLFTQSSFLSCLASYPRLPSFSVNPKGRGDEAPGVRRRPRVLYLHGEKREKWAKIGFSTFLDLQEGKRGEKMSQSFLQPSAIFQKREKTKRKLKYKNFGISKILSCLLPPSPLVFDLGEDANAKGPRALGCRRRGKQDAKAKGSWEFSPRQSRNPVRGSGNSKILAFRLPLRPWSSSLAFPDAFGLTPKGLGRESQGPLRSSLRLRRPLAFASSPRQSRNPVRGRSKTKGEGEGNLVRGNGRNEGESKTRTPRADGERQEPSLPKEQKPRAQFLPSLAFPFVPPLGFAGPWRSRLLLGRRPRAKGKATSYEVTGGIKSESQGLLNRRPRANHFLRKFASYPALPPKSLNVLSFIYSQIGQLLTLSQLLKDVPLFLMAQQNQKSSSSIYDFILSQNHESKQNFSGSTTESSSSFQQKNKNASLFTDLYAPSENLKKQCIRLFSGKIGEFFVLDSSLSFSELAILPSVLSLPIFPGSPVYDKSGTKGKARRQNQKPIGYGQCDNKGWALPTLPQNFNLFGSSATAFISSFIHKRSLHQQNLLVFRMLHFENKISLKSPPSPPGSSILGILRRHENLKRNEKSFSQKEKFSIHQKMTFHQQQNLMKTLYNKPYQKYFRSENESSFSPSLVPPVPRTRLPSPSPLVFEPSPWRSPKGKARRPRAKGKANSTVPNLKTNFKNRFDSAFKDLGYLPSSMLQPTSSSAYYRKTLLMRHRFYFTNQWWNGQLPEQSTESTFLSDVDWRSLFVESLGDLTIDFPDADQHYNPRQRRWILHSGYWGYWFSFQKSVYAEIQNHFVQECFNKSFVFLNKQREILDALAYFFLVNGFLNESRFLNTLARF